MGKKKGKNSSARTDNPGKGQSLQNSLQYELRRYKWENSARGQQLAAQNLYLDQFNLTAKEGSAGAYPQLKVLDPLQQQQGPCALQRTFSSMKEVDRHKEAAATARWHYSSPRVRIAREKLLQQILLKGQEEEEEEENGGVCASTSGSGSKPVRRLCDLCLENIAANLQRYDATELAVFIQQHLEPAHLLHICVHAASLHTLNDHTLAAVTPHQAAVVVCPRDLTHGGLLCLLHSYQTKAFVLHENWEMLDMSALALHKLVGPRSLYFIGSALKVASYTELRHIFPLEQLTLHAVALPVDLPKALQLSKGTSTAAGAAAAGAATAGGGRRGGKYSTNVPDKLEVLHKMREFNLDAGDDYSHLLVLGGSNPYVQPGSGTGSSEKEQTCFKCAAVLCYLFLAPVPVSASVSASGTAANSGDGGSKTPPPAPGPAAAAARGFENVTSLTFSHCRWGWSIESLLLFAYRLAAAMLQEPEGTSGSGNGSGSGGSSNGHGTKNMSLCNLRRMTVEGAELFQPPAGCARISDADTRKVRRACAVFRAICSVQLCVDGITCGRGELGEEGEGEG